MLAALPAAKVTQHIKIADNYLPAELCGEIIARFDADPRILPDPQPDYSTRWHLHASRYPEWRDLSLSLSRYANAYVAAYFKRPKALAHGTYHEWGDDGFVVSRYAPGDACILHVDGQSAEAPYNALRIATLIFYLNDVAHGGELYFPLQDLRIRPEVGRAVIFPNGFTHPHEVLKTKSHRYAVQTWITDPNYVVNLPGKPLPKRPLPLKRPRRY